MSKIDDDQINSLLHQVRVCQKINKALREKNEWLLEGVSQSEIVLRDTGHKDKADKLLEIMKSLRDKETK